jgi:hypothetical protein
MRRLGKSTPRALTMLATRRTLRSVPFAAACVFDSHILHTSPALFSCVHRATYPLSIPDSLSQTPGVSAGKVPRSAAQHMLIVTSVILEETLGLLKHECPEWNLDAEGAK